MSCNRIEVQCLDLSLVQIHRNLGPGRHERRASLSNVDRRYLPALGRENGLDERRLESESPTDSSSHHPAGPVDADGEQFMLR